MKRNCSLFIVHFCSSANGNQETRACCCVLICSCSSLQAKTKKLMNFKPEIEVIQCQWLLVQKLLLSPLGFQKCNTMCKELDTLISEIKKLRVSVQTVFGFDSRWMPALFFHMVQFLHPRAAFFLKHVSSKWYKLLNSPLLRHYLKAFPLDVDWSDTKLTTYPIPSPSKLIISMKKNSDSTKPNARFYAYYQNQDQEVLECKTDIVNDSAFALWNQKNKEFVTYFHEIVVGRWTWKECLQDKNMKWCLHKGSIYALYENEFYAFDCAGRCLKRTHRQTESTVEMINFTIDQDQTLYAVGMADSTSEIVVIQFHLDSFLRTCHFWFPFCFRPNSIAIYRGILYILTSKETLPSQMRPDEQALYAYTMFPSDQQKTSRFWLLCSMYLLMATDCESSLQVEADELFLRLGLKKMVVQLLPHCVT